MSFNGIPLEALIGKTYETKAIESTSTIPEIIKNHTKLESEVLVKTCLEQDYEFNGIKRVMALDSGDYTIIFSLNNGTYGCCNAKITKDKLSLSQIKYLESNSSLLDGSTHTGFIMTINTKQQQYEIIEQFLREHGLSIDDLKEKKEEE